MVQHLPQPSKKKKLVFLQKKIIRALSCSEINSPTHPPVHHFELLRLAELNEYHNACLMFQVVNRLNSRLSSVVPISSPQHTYQMRIKPFISGKCRRHVRASMSVVCRRLQIWNRIDDGLKVLPFISNFKRQLKNNFLLSYN